MPTCRRCATTTTGRAQLCDPCRAARDGTKKTRAKKPAAPAPAPLPEAPEGLRRRGAALWQDLGVEQGTAAGELGLEVCRMADRLDELDRIVAGKGVLALMKFRVEELQLDDDGDSRLTVTVNFQSVLTEARGQQTVFKELLKELRTTLAAGAPATNPGQAGKPTPAAPAATGLDEVTRKRRAREQKTG